MNEPISRSRALNRILSAVTPLPCVMLPPHQAVGLAASAPVAARCDVPEQPCSLRDGYALRARDIADAGPMKPVILTVTQTVRAEYRSAEPVGRGQAARVLTGGLVPPGCDAVLAEEDVSIDTEAQTIAVSEAARPGWFVRPAGGEVAAGSVLADAGGIVTPQAAAVITRSKVECVPVHPRPFARVIALGSELAEPGCPCEGCARFPADNLVLAGGLLGQAGAEVTETGVLPDEADRLVEVLSAEDLPDVVITTGGTGRSERDFARHGARQAGFIPLFDQVDIRPGRNMFAAQRGTTLLFCLPGPPMAVFSCMHAFIIPAVRRLRGLADPGRTVTAHLNQGISARPGGDWLLTVTLALEGGKLVATPLAGKATPPLFGLSQAHGLALLAGGSSVLPDGPVEVVMAGDVF